MFVKVLTYESSVNFYDIMIWLPASFFLGGGGGGVWGGGERGESGWVNISRKQAFSGLASTIPP